MKHRSHPIAIGLASDGLRRQRSTLEYPWS